MAQNFLSDIQLGDSIYIRLGDRTFGDLNLYHNGTNSFIDNHTGNVYIRNFSDDKNIHLQSDDGSGGMTDYIVVHGSENIVKFQEHTRHLDNKEARFGTGSDLKIYHDGTNSYLDNATGDLYVRNNKDDADIVFQSDDGSGGLATYFYLDGGSVNTRFVRHARFTDGYQLQLGNSADMAIFHSGTNSFIQNATGDLYIDNDKDDGDIIFRSDDGAGNKATYFALDGGITRTVAYKNFNFQDNVKLEMGTGADLQIYHDGTHSYIDGTTTGDLYVRSTNDDVVIQGADDVFIYTQGGEDAIIARGDGAVELYYDNSKKLETTNAGIKITGIPTIETATVSGTALYIHNTTDSVENTTTLIDFRAHASDNSSFYVSGQMGSKAEGTWTSTSSTRDASLIFNTVLNGNNELALTLASDKSATFAGSVKTEGPDGGLILRTWTGGSSYGSFSTANMSGNEYAVLTDGTHTFISGGTGGSVHIRAGNNVSNHELEITSNLATFKGNLQVNGDLNIVGNSSVVNVEDLNVEQGEITLNYNASSDTSGSANGSGIRIQDAVDASNDATMLWDQTNAEFDFSHGATLGGKLTIPTGSYDEIVFTGTGGAKILAPVEMYLDSGAGIYLMDDNGVNLTLSGSNATFAGWIKGASDTNTLYSSTSLGTLLQTPGNTAGNNNSKIFFRDNLGNNKHTFDTNNGNATFTGDVTVNGGDITVNTTGKATLTLNGDSDNSGDAAVLDSEIKMLHDAGDYGILLQTQNHSGRSSFKIVEKITTTETMRFQIDETGDATFSGEIIGNSDITTTNGLIKSTRTGANMPSSSNANLYLVDSRSMTNDVGGSIVFGGVYNGNGDIISGGPFIKGYKENNTAGDYGFGLKFAVRENGSGAITDPCLTLNSSGNATFVGAVKSAENTDSVSVFGRTAIGFVSGLSDYAMISHYDRQSSSNYALLQSSSGSTYLNGTDVNLSIGGTRKVTVDSNGKVGVGTTSPQNILHVHQSDADSHSYVHITQEDGGSASTDGMSIGVLDGGVNASVRLRENGYLNFWTNNTERMRIASDGAIQTNADNGTPLQLTGIANGGQELRMRQSRGTVASPTNSSTNGDGNYLTSYVYANSAYASIGHIGIITGSATNDGEIQFSTASGGTVSERARITSTGEFKGPILYEMKNNAGDQSNATSPRIYSPSGGTFGLSAGGAERLTINSTGATFAGTVTSTGPTTIKSIAGSGQESVLNFSSTNVSGFGSTYAIDSKIRSITADSSNAYASELQFFTSDTSDNVTLALTLDESQNATFEGEMVVGESTMAMVGIEFSTTNLRIKPKTALANGRIFREGNYLIYDSPSAGHKFAVAGNASTNVALTIDSSQNATFAGQVETKNNAGIYSFSDTVNAGSSEDIFKLDNSHGAQAFRVTFVCNTSGFSVAKTFEVVHQFAGTPVFAKVVDTGAYSNNDFTVAFANDSDTGVKCTITNSGATINADIVTTVFLGGSPTDITVTEL